MVCAGNGMLTRTVLPLRLWSRANLHAGSDRCPSKHTCSGRDQSARRCPHHCARRADGCSRRYDAACTGGHADFSARRYSSAASNCNQ